MIKTGGCSKKSNFSEWNCKLQSVRSSKSAKKSAWIAFLDHPSFISIQEWNKMGSPKRSYITQT